MTFPEDGAGEWPRAKRTKTLIRAALLVFAGVFFALIVVETTHPGFLFPPSGKRQAQTIAALAGQIRKAYGPTLQGVDVRYARKEHVSTYYTSFRLKGVPLGFSFADPDQQMNGDRSSSYLAYPELIGGAERFVALAQSFHHDFPAQRTMAIRRTAAGNLPAPLPQLAEGLRPAVLVFRSDSDAQARTGVVAVYAWDEVSQAWRLLHRGPLPETGGET